MRLYSSVLKALRAAAQALSSDVGERELRRSVRASTWAGRWTHRRWAKDYYVGVEDPCDATDNCARSIAPAALPRMVATFGAGADVLAIVASERGRLPSAFQGLGGCFFS